MARAAIAVGVGCVVVCAGWWMFAQGAAGPSLAPDPALAASSQMPSPATGPVPAAVAPPVPEAAAIERTSAPEPEPGSQPPIPADAKWADVLVVDKQTDKPVADAEACWSDETQMLLVAKLPPLARDAAYRDLERVAKQFGWHGRSDRDGRLRVNLGKNGTQVFARAGSRYGEARLNAQTEDPKERQRILLEEDETVRVRVLDAVGRPAAGVPVSLDPFDATRKGRTSFGGEPYTDAEGTALFAHVQARRSWGDKRELATQFAIRICIGGFPIEPVLIDAQPPPIEPVEVRLPPTGRLRAKVTFEDKPLPGLDALTVHAGREKGETYGDDYKAPLAPDGWAHFGYVPVGKMLYVGSGHATGAWDLEVQGPTVLDQEVTASFELAGEVIALTGRLLEVDGSPVANQQVQGDITSTLIGGGVFMQTDEAGHFVCTLGRHRPEWKRELKLSKLAFERRPADAPAQRVEVPARDLVVGRNDLGDLRFSVAALVVAGRFVFDTPGSSRPWFQVQRFWTSQGRAGPVEHWDAMDGLQMDSREDGTFEVRGTLAADRYRLSVMAQDLLPADPVEFALGAKDLTIAVRRGARLTVTCVLPEGLDPQRVVLRLHVAGAVSHARGSAARQELGAERREGEVPVAGVGTRDIRAAGRGPRLPRVAAHHRGRRRAAARGR
jgi:hypothetical protein